MRRKINDRNVLFLCQDNTCLSQMAEAVAKHLRPPKTQIYSAGIAPKAIPAEVIDTVAAAGISMAQQTSKSLAEVPMNEIDLVISFGDAYKECSNLPGRTKIERWPIPESSTDVGMTAMEASLDDIEKRVFGLFMDYWRNVA
jgi:arsenate reductase